MLSLVSSIKCSSQSTSIAGNNIETVNYSLAQIKNYFESNLVSHQSFIPSWIADDLLTHFIADKEFQNELFNGLFSHNFCYISKVKLPKEIKHLVLQCRLFHLNSFNLTCLDLSYCSYIDNALLTSFTTSKAVITLKVLILKGCHSFTNVTCLRAFVNLHHLDLSENSNLDFLEFQSCIDIISILASQGNLVTLDLHFTNFFNVLWEPKLPITCTSTGDITLQIQKLYLYIDPDLFQESPPGQNLIAFYTALSSLTSLTHLDLSGWPLLELFPNPILTRFCNSLQFFGLYQTSLTTFNHQLELKCFEISGSCNENQILSTLQHYSKNCSYLNSVLETLIHSLRHKLIDLSTSMVQLFNLHILDSVAFHLTTIDSISKVNSVHFLTNSMKSLYTLYFQTTDSISNHLRQRDIDIFIAVFHRIDCVNIGERDLLLILYTTLCFYFYLMSDIRVVQQAMNSISIKFLFAIIRLTTSDPDKYASFVLMPQIITLIFYIFGKLASNIPTLERVDVGLGSEAIDSFFEFIKMKLSLKQLDKDVLNTMQVIMNIVNKHYPNCLHLCEQKHSTILIQLIEDPQADEVIVIHILAVLENIAWFCPNYVQAYEASVFMPIVTVILRSPQNYKQEIVTSAIAFTSYYALGHEMWSWEESGEEALSCVENCIEHLDYKIPRSVIYNCIDTILMCLNARDPRVNLCALFVLCNLLNGDSQHYCKLVADEYIATTRSIASRYPQDSIYSNLATTILSFLSDP